MKWIFSDAKYGDIVRVKLGDIYHYGIYVNNEEIVQFGLPINSLNRDYSKIKVCVSDLKTFLNGGLLERGEVDVFDLQKKSADEIVACARKRIGEGGYNIFYNNCEHFANECAFGQKKCSQVDAVREMWKNYPFVNVYVKKYPFDVSKEEIYPQERINELDKCSNIDVKNQKYYVWKLLEYGLKNSYNIDIKDVGFQKDGYKWMCDKCKFSLSHSGNVVAVAISRFDVGVDVEQVDLERFEKMPERRILTEAEISRYKNMQKKEKINLLNNLWTVKESIFKKGKDKVYSPTKIDEEQTKHITKKVVVDGEEYYLSVAADNVNFVKFYFGESVKEQK